MRRYTNELLQLSFLVSFLLFINGSGLSQNQREKTDLQNAPNTLSFTDISFSSGFIASGGPATFGGHAVLFADATGDDRPDLFISMLLDDRPLEDLFFRNLSGASFSEEGDDRGLADFDGGTHGAAFADLDNDGDYDLVNGATIGVNQNPATTNIYRNDAGFFSDATASAGIPALDWPTRAVLSFDMDGDGDLDIFCVTNTRGSDDPPDERNEVYRNDGNLEFSSINFGALYTAPVAQGATDTDYDNDGDVDVIAGNRTGDLNILRNNGFGTFELISPASIGIVHQGREGAAMADLDNDGDLDMVLSDWDFSADHAVEHLYFNQGNGTFVHDTTFADVDGYMAGLADLDNDRDVDIIFSGHEVSYLNNGNGKFVAGPQVPLAGISSARAIGFSDIDDDGDLDFSIGAKNSRNWLIRNNLNAGNWLKVKLISPRGQAGAFGAKVKVYPAGDAGGELVGFREARSNTGYLAQDDPVLHFGLGPLTAVDVVVTFLDETVMVKSNVAANQSITMDGSDNIVNTPVIASFSPEKVQVGDYIQVNGQNFSDVFSIEFNGTAAENFTIFSDSKIEVQIPEQATSGFVRMRNSQGSGTSSSELIIVYPPEIHSFEPTVGTVGMEVLITGNRFDEVKSIFFGTSLSLTFTIETPTQIRVRVPQSAKDGPITISNSAGLATSSTVFDVVPESITLNSPNGGELLFSATSQTILWDAFGVFDTVRLEFSPDDGDNWMLLEDGIANDGRYEWIIPEDVVTDEALLRIFDAGDSDPIDASDGVFTISRGMLSLVVPNGGEQWAPGEMQTITWQTSGAIDSVKLEFSRNAGATWTDVAVGPNNQSFDWQVPQVTSDSCLIRISDSSDGVVVDMSDTPFSIGMTTHISDDTGTPTDFNLYANYPNPFNPETTISYDLPRSAQVRIIIYDALGRRVRTLHDARQSSGRHLITWDAKNDDGEPVSSGVYFYQLISERVSLLRKMLLLR